MNNKIEFAITEDSNAKYIRCLSCNAMHSVAGSTSRRNHLEQVWKVEHSTGHKIKLSVPPPVSSGRVVNTIIGSLNTEFV